MSALLLHPRAVLITGVADDPGGVAVRVFVGPRYRGRYFLVSEPDAVARCRRAWSSTNAHVIATLDELEAVGILLTEAGR